LFLSIEGGGLGGIATIVIVLAHPGKHHLCFQVLWHNDYKALTGEVFLLKMCHKPSSLKRIANGW
jgi:hypothetical protein